MVDRGDAHPDVRRSVEPVVILAVGMVVLALATFAAMLGFVRFCDRL